MAAKKFSSGEAIRFGWETTKDNFGFFIRVLLVLGFISVVQNAALTSGDSGAIPIILVLSILQAIVSLGATKISLKFVDGEKPEFGDLFSPYPLFFKYLIAGLIYGIVVYIGLILLIIPGIYFAIRHVFYIYPIVDRGAGATDAIKTSSKITKGAIWELVTFGILLSVINILGAIALLVGLFITIPVSMVAIAFVYRELANQAEEEIPETPIEKQKPEEKIEKEPPKKSGPMKSCPYCKGKLSELNFYKLKSGNDITCEYCGEIISH